MNNISAKFLIILIWLWGSLDAFGQNDKEIMNIKRYDTKCIILEDTTNPLNTLYGYMFDSTNTNSEKLNSYIPPKRLVKKLEKAIYRNKDFESLNKYYRIYLGAKFQNKTYIAVQFVSQETLESNQNYYSFMNLTSAGVKGDVKAAFYIIVNKKIELFNYYGISR